MNLIFPGMYLTPGISCFVIQITVLGWKSAQYPRRIGRTEIKGSMGIAIYT